MEPDGCGITLLNFRGRAMIMPRYLQCSTATFPGGTYLLGSATHTPASQAGDGHKRVAPTSSIDRTGNVIRI